MAGGLGEEARQLLFTSAEVVVWQLQPGARPRSRQISLRITGDRPPVIGDERTLLDGREKVFRHNNTKADHGQHKTTSGSG
jgi:hypothetical protein